MMCGPNSCLQHACVTRGDDYNTMRISRKEEHGSTATAPLLPVGKVVSSSNTDQKPARMTRFIFISVIVSTCIAALSVVCIYGYASHSKPTLESARPLKKLTHPVVLMVSFDGFRFGYQFKTDTPNIHRLIENGTEAELGLIPVFPTATFPNHYSIVTGLYPPYHGIVHNYDFIDPDIGRKFSKSDNDPRWWLGEPLWDTVVKHGLKAATFYWPGSEVKKDSWTCPEEYCMAYKNQRGLDARVDAVLNYFDNPNHEDIPSFVTLYVDHPDKEGHQVGADDPRITGAVARVDELLGRLIGGLDNRGVLEDVNIILVGDHGMVATCGKKMIYLTDFAKWLDIPEDWVFFYGPILGLQPPPSYSKDDIKNVVDKMKQGLASGEVNNGEYLRIYLREDLPGRLHYSDNKRIPPILGLLEEGFQVKHHKLPDKDECGGAHGYDNAFFSMRSIFVGHGPRFARGKKVESFQNVEIYNLVTRILNIPDGAPNNGTMSFPEKVLLL